MLGELQQIMTYIAIFEHAFEELIRTNFVVRLLISSNEIVIALIRTFVWNII